MLEKFKRLFINQSKIDVLLKTQKNIKAKNYSLGNEMYGSVQISKDSNSLESGMLLQKHLKNKNARLLAITDASKSWSNLDDFDPSNFVLRHLSKWFNSLDKYIFKNSELVSQRLEQFVVELNDELAKKVSTPLTSLACAVVCDDQTVLLSVGSNSVHIQIGKFLREGVRNDLLSTKLKEDGVRFNSEPRFHGSSLVSLQSLGVKDEVKPNIKIVDNCYDSIMLSSRSVFRNLSSDDIELISAVHPIEEVPGELVRSSLHNVSELEKPHLCYESKIRPGETDLLVAVYKRKVRKK